MRIFEFLLKFKNKLKKLLVFYLFQYPRIQKYKFLSNCKHVKGNPIYNQPVLLLGNGSIIFGKNVNLGINPSPYFYNGYGYIEARKSDCIISIRDNVFINNNFVIISECEGIEIGEKTLIGVNVEIIDSDFHDLNPDNRLMGTPETGKISIGKNVFIGNNVKILKGVTIGDNSVIGNGAVVVKSIPENVVAAGVPAKVIRKLNDT